MSLLRRYLPAFTLVFAITGLYLYNLDGVGVLGPDEPRYAAIGHAMAQSGDFLTPRLWGSPWFEKPPLLYWLTALGAAAGLNSELSARLPVALLSLAFLAVTFGLLALEFGEMAAAVSTILLATSAGWLVFSSISVTDLPLACFFSLAILVILPLLPGGKARAHKHARLLASGVFLGLAALAKGLLPFVLVLPACWFLRKLWRDWWLAAAGCLLIAAPWYTAMYLKNGWPFVEEFLLKHHFARLYSPALQHVQPWFFYLPVLLGLAFPWTPLLLLGIKLPWQDERRRFLLATFVFGFCFFSLSLNKLASYLLPLLPLLFALIGSTFEYRMLARLNKLWLLPCAVLIATIPVLTQALPQMLSAGRWAGFHMTRLSATEWFYVAAPLGVIVLARRSWTGPVLVLCVVAGGIYLKVLAYPLLDASVSPRGMWQEVKPVAGNVCEEWIKRDWVYGFSYYHGALIPPCFSDPRLWKLVRQPGSDRPRLLK